MARRLESSQAQQIRDLVEEHEGRTFVTVEGERYEADLVHIGRTGAYSLLLNGASFEFTLSSDAEEVELSGGAGHFHFTVEDARTHAARAKTASARGATGPKTIKAQMPGIVREVKVAEGDVVVGLQGFAVINCCIHRGASRLL